jgi:hypothetical protein
LTLCDEVLNLDERIRFVAHLDQNENLIEMKQKTSVKSLTKEKTDQEFFSFIQPIVLGACSKLEKDMGCIKTVRVKYQKASIVFLRIHGAILGISMDPGPTTPVVSKIGQKYGVDLT